MMLLAWPLTYNTEKLITLGHYHYQCVFPYFRTIHQVPFKLSRLYNSYGGQWVTDSFDMKP